jgi:hypothetical protein
MACPAAAAGLSGLPSDNCGLGHLRVCELPEIHMSGPTRVPGARGRAALCRHHAHASVHRPQAAPAANREAGATGLRSVAAVWACVDDRCGYGMGGATVKEQLGAALAHACAGTMQQRSGVV